MRGRGRNFRKPPEKGPRVIDRPRPGQIRVIGDDGNQLGIMPISEAVSLAEEKGLDLVEIAPNADPPTCKLMDYGKFKYQQTRKTRQSKKTVVRRKEVKLRPKTEAHDFQVKVERAKRFLDKGHKVLVTMIFRGREIVHIDMGGSLLLKFAEALADCAKIEKDPSREGRNRVDMILAPRPRSRASGGGGGGGGGSSGTGGTSPEGGGTEPGGTEPGGGAGGSESAEA